MDLKKGEKYLYEIILLKFKFWINEPTEIIDVFIYNSDYKYKSTCLLIYIQQTIKTTILENQPP